MKKIILFLFMILFLCGCSQTTTEVSKEEKVDIQKEEVSPVYQDQNQTPIGIYSLSGNTLTKLTTITKPLVVEEDIGIFQIYLSTDDSISLSKEFAESYYEEWNKYPNIKLGFNVKFHLVTGEDVSYNILKPDECMKRWEHLMTYLYDDYQNRGKGFYSHIEDKDYNENTLFTAIKIQSSYQVSEIDSPIQLTVFTYDSEDDFDENSEYRGNSHYSIKICNQGIPC